MTEGPSRIYRGSSMYRGNVTTADRREAHAGMRHAPAGLVESGLRSSIEEVRQRGVPPRLSPCQFWRKGHPPAVDAADAAAAAAAATRLPQLPTDTAIPIPCEARRTRWAGTSAKAWIAGQQLGHGNWATAMAWQRMQ